MKRRRSADLRVLSSYARVRKPAETLTHVLMFIAGLRERRPADERLILGASQHRQGQSGGCGGSVIRIGTWQKSLRSAPLLSPNKFHRARGSFLKNTQYSPLSLLRARKTCGSTGGE